MRKMIVPALAAFMASSAFAQIGNPPQSTTMPVTINVAKYVKITAVGGAIVNVPSPGAWDSDPSTGSGDVNGTFTVESNCDGNVAIAKDTNKQVVLGSKQYKIDNGGAELTWGAEFVNETGTGTPRDEALVKGTVTVYPVKITVTTGTAWKDAWAGQYLGDIDVTVTSP